MRKQALGTCRYFIFEVSLREVTPKICRRFMIAQDARFVDLHEAIQEACGWTNSHLFAFEDEKGDVIAELPSDEFEETGPDAFEVSINTYFGSRKAKRCLYKYDFGDGREHDVELAETVNDWPEKFDRKLLDGARSFPPDDCGGIGGYEECVVVALGREKDPERLKWLDGWKPEKFDFKETARLFYQAKLFLRGHYEEEL